MFGSLGGLKRVFLTEVRVHLRSDVMNLWAARTSVPAIQLPIAL